MPDIALLVGINRYKDKNNLRGCENDVDAAGVFLEHKCDFAWTDIMVLKSEEATSDSIRAALQNAVKQAKKKAAAKKNKVRFVFWFSGHGAEGQVDGENCDLICPHDYDPKIRSSYLTSRDLAKIFADLPPEADSLWVSDSCHSGDLETDLYRTGVPRMRKPHAGLDPRGKKHRLRDAASQEGIAFIAGCHGNQTSADAFVGGEYRGVLSAYLLRQLSLPGGFTATLRSVVWETHAAITQAGFTQEPLVRGSHALLNRPVLSLGDWRETEGRESNRTILVESSSAQRQEHPPGTRQEHPPGGPSRQEHPPGERQEHPPGERQEHPPG